MIEFQLIDDTENVEVQLLDNTENVEVELIKEIDRYPDLKDLPSINNVTLVGNKTLHELGIQPEGDYPTIPEIEAKLAQKVDKIAGKGLSTNDYTTPEKNKLASLENYDDTEIRELIDGKQPKGNYLTEETDPTVPNHVKSITQNNITNWNNKQEQLISGTNIKTINNESILGSGNINIESGGSVKTLSTSDYDYPVNNPTSIAGWLLEPDIYQVDGTNVVIRRHPEENVHVAYDTGDIFIKLTEASSSVTTIKPKYLYTQNKNNDFSYYTDVNEFPELIKIKDIINNLTTQSAYLPLSANQGYILKQLVDTKVSNTDYATNSVGGVVKVTVGDHGLNMESGTLKGVVKTYSQYNDMSSKGVVSKGTLENVITGKGLITNAVDDLVNYYKTSETFTKQEVNDLISAITTMDIQVVQTLPTEDISTTTIYLVPKTMAETNDAYDEYIYVSNNWEHIGSTEVDLTDYVKNTDYAGTDTGGVIKIGSSYGTAKASSGHLISSIKTYEDYSSLGNYAFISKGTLENVITGKGLYAKPSDGIPKSDLASAVQTSLGKADTALQSYTETDPTVPSHVKSITQANITSWNNKSDFDGDYNSLTNIPTIPDELSDLTDDSTHRLVTDAEKTTWNGKADVSDIPKYYYGTSDTAAATRAKVVECEGFVLEEGATISVRFTYAQTYNGAPYLNVNDTGNVVIQYKGGSSGIRYMWSAGEIIDFTYDGTYWVCHGRGLATTSYYGLTKLYTGAGSDSQTYALTPRSLYYFANFSIAPYYSTSSTYAVGDKVRHTYYLYECTTAIETAEAWDENHWQQIDTLQEQIDNINTTIGDIETLLSEV